MTAVITAGTLILAGSIVCTLLWHRDRRYRRTTAAPGRPRDGAPLTCRDQRILASIEHHERGLS